MKLFGSPDTYDLARGLALGGQSSSLTLAEQSREIVFPFLDPSASLVGGGLHFIPSPRWGRGLLLLLLAFVGGICLGVIVRWHLKKGTLSSARGLLLGLLLRHHVGCQSQQPC